MPNLDNRNKDIDVELEEELDNEDVDTDLEDVEDLSDTEENDEIENEDTDDEEGEEDETEDEIEQKPQQKQKVKSIVDEDDIDYKEKYVGASQEAQVLSARNKQLTETIEEASKVASITDEELKAEAEKEGLYFEELTPTEKILLKKGIIADRRFSMVNTVVQESSKEAKAVEEWSQKIDQFLDTEENKTKFPQINGQEQEFKKFALKGTRRGLDFEDLVSAFSYTASREVKKHKGSLLLSGSGAKTNSSGSKELNEDDVATLRVRDSRKYARLIKSGKIDIKL